MCSLTGVEKSPVQVVLSAAALFATTTVSLTPAPSSRASSPSIPDQTQQPSAQADFVSQQANTETLPRSRESIATTAQPTEPATAASVETSFEPTPSSLSIATAPTPMTTSASVKTSVEPPPSSLRVASAHTTSASVETSSGPLPLSFPIASAPTSTMTSIASHVTSILTHAMIGTTSGTGGFPVASTAPDPSTISIVRTDSASPTQYPTSAGGIGDYIMSGLGGGSTSETVVPITTNADSTIAPVQSNSRNSAEGTSMGNSTTSGPAVQTAVGGVGRAAELDCLLVALVFAAVIVLGP